MLTIYALLMQLTVQVYTPCITRWQVAQLMSHEYVRGLSIKYVDFSHNSEFFYDN